MEDTVDPTNTAVLAQRLVELLAKVPSESRRRAISAAMTMLGEEHLERAGAGAGTARRSDNEVSSDLGTLFSSDEKLRPSENAYLCAGYHYSRYGNAAFSLDDVRAIASEAGVVLPDRLDMTLKQAGKSGKRLFQAAGRDAYRPTAAAGLLFKERWNIRPGNENKGSEPQR